jgi:hypothetical protein
MVLHSLSEIYSCPQGQGTKCSESSLYPGTFSHLRNERQCRRPLDIAQPDHPYCWFFSAMKVQFYRGVAPIFIGLTAPNYTNLQAV